MFAITADQTRAHITPDSRTLTSSCGWGFSAVHTCSMGTWVFTLLLKIWRAQCEAASDYKKTRKPHQEQHEKNLKMENTLEVAFNLTEESVHFNILLLIKFLPNPGKTGQNDIHKPVRSNLWKEMRPVYKFWEEKRSTTQQGHSSSNL